MDRERRRNTGAVALDDAGDLPDAESLSQIVERSDALERLNSWIRGLKTADRQIMTLYLEDLPASAIAEIAGLSPGAVATRISRLKHQLSKDFQEQTHA